MKTIYSSCRLPGLVATLWLTGLDRHQAVGLDNAFSVPSLSLRAFINPDASVGLVYDVEIKNDRRARLVDLLLLRTPSRAFTLRHVVVSLDGDPLRNLRLPLNGDCGVEIALGDQAIPPGGRATLHVELTLEAMVTSDFGHGDRAALAIAPPWFDEQSPGDLTDLTVAVHALPGIKRDELVALPADATTSLFAERATASWQRPRCRLAETETSRVSFPRRGMQRVVERSWLGLFADWFGRSLVARAVAAVLFFTLYALAWHRTIGGRQIAAFVVIAATLAALFLMSPVGHLLAFLPLAGLGAWGPLRDWRRRLAEARAGAVRTSVPGGEGEAVSG